MQKLIVQRQNRLEQRILTVGTVVGSIDDEGNIKPNPGFTRGEIEARLKGSLQNPPRVVKESEFIAPEEPKPQKAKTEIVVDEKTDGQETQNNDDLTIRTREDLAEFLQVDPDALKAAIDHDNWPVNKRGPWNNDALNAIIKYIDEDQDADQAQTTEE